MVRTLLAGILCTYSAVCLSQEINFEKTNARVTYDASTFWVDSLGPALTQTIYIRGEINRDTAVLVRRYYDDLIELNRRYEEDVNMKPEVRGHSAINFQLDSLGGEVDTAIAIGRFVREKQGNVLVTENEHCASACILILAGGAHRTVSGNLGIHRLFLDAPSRTMTTNDVKKVITERQDQLRAYFREMNISERLADDMMMIPSAQMKWLAPEEIALYGLGVDDPVIQETKSLSEANKYGLSRVEYETRKQRAQKLCSFGSPTACWENVMRGFPSDTVRPSQR